VSRYQKGKTNLDFNEARDMEWHWHQLGHMQVCTFFTGRMPFLPPNQQGQSTEGKILTSNMTNNLPGYTSNNKHDNSSRKLTMLRNLSTFIYKLV